jgi:type IV pilus biogenesis/stability protein PilW
MLLHGLIERASLLAMLTVLLIGCAPSKRIRLQADNRYQLAQSYLGQRSYLLAEQEIRKAIALEPHEPRYFELLALINQAQGRLQLADEAYRRALQEPDVSSSVLANYGTLLLKRGQVDDAIVLLRRASSDPNYTRQALVYTNLGLAYLKKGDLRQAAAQLLLALEYQPNLPEAHHNLGLVYARLGEYEQAIQEFREAIRARPSYVEAHASLGNALMKMGRLEEARLAFERVVALEPDSDLAVASRKRLRLLNP